MQASNCSVDIKIQWEKLHSKSLENAAAAEEVAKVMSQVGCLVSKRFAAITELRATPRSSRAEESLREVENDLITAERQLNLIEKVIDERELKKDVIEQDALQLDAKYQLALYKEQRVAHFEKYKADREAPHNSKIATCDKLMETSLKIVRKPSRQLTKKMLKVYKQSGQIRSNSIGSAGGVSLEEVEVEPDQEDSKALDQFLEGYTVNTLKIKLYLSLKPLI